MTHSRHAETCPCDEQSQERTSMCPYRSSISHSYSHFHSRLGVQKPLQQISLINTQKIICKLYSATKLPNYQRQTRLHTRLRTLLDYWPSLILTTCLTKLKFDQFIYISGLNFKKQDWNLKNIARELRLRLIKIMHPAQLVLDSTTV
jgi:hypothetical protein